MKNSHQLAEEIKKRIIGQNEVVEALIIGLLCDGHILLEGLPGLAKTTAVKALADATHFSLGRIQFTPDLLPADLVGTQIYNPKSMEFHVKKGPVFANLVIADEINRSPAKVQSALLQAMQEREVSIGDQTFPLPDPFLVLATQNPIEQEGTYELPEAQRDRFMLKVLVDYTSKEDEIKILELMAHTPEVCQVMDEKTLKAEKEKMQSVHVSEAVRRYIVNLVFASRESKKYITFGASPRASIFLEKASRAKAFLDGAEFVTPQHVKDVAKLVLRHRIGLSYEAELENIQPDFIVDEILATIAVP